MATLIILIDRSNSTAKFSGPGTFGAKDRIKELGRARWIAAEKSWEVSPFNLTLLEVKEKFPDSTVEESGTPAVVERPLEESSQSAFPPSLTVSQLLSKIGLVVETAFPRTTYVRGVISSVNRPSAGRVFLELAEEEKREEVVRCVLWKDEARVCKRLNELGFILEPNLQVLLEVRVSLSRKFANISLEIVGVVGEYTLGKLAALRDQTNERLKKENLFHLNKTKKLPFLPTRLGILTSSAGTVINDFRNSLDEAKFGFELFWYPVRVQGGEAKRDILQGIEKLSTLNLDAILIFRGGGSAADLSVFNDYDIARSICLCSCPVVAAIGHQEDQSSVQDVSCVALGVPKDLGRFFADMITQRREAVRDFSKSIESLVRGIEASSRQKLSWAINLIVAVPVQFLVAQLDACRRFSVELPVLGFSQLRKSSQAVATTGDKLEISSDSVIKLNAQRLALALRFVTDSDNILSRWEREISYLGQLVESNSVESQLSRGFVLVYDAQGEAILTSAEKLHSGDSASLKFRDGSKRITIN